MKTLLLAAATVLAIGSGAAFAETSGNLDLAPSRDGQAAGQVVHTDAAHAGMSAGKTWTSSYNLGNG